MKFRLFSSFCLAGNEIEAGGRGPSFQEKSSTD